MRSSSSSPSSPLLLRLSWTWFWSCLVTASVLPYFMARSLFVVRQQHSSSSSSWSPQTTTPTTTTTTSTSSSNQQTVEVVYVNDDAPPATAVVQRQFPAPRLHPGKVPPLARYTGQCFDNPVVDAAEPSTQDSTISTTTTTTTTWSQHRVDVHLDLEEDLSHNNVTTTEEHDYDHQGGPYEPAGQHLLMDIQHVSPQFLLDTQALVQAMLQIVTQSKLTLLSYHCHDLQAPLGVSCVGVLLESHVSLHTWPHAGVIALDLFTCGSQSLLPLLPLLTDLFAMRDDSVSNAPLPHMTWSHKKRGYRNYFHTDGSLRYSHHSNDNDNENNHNHSTTHTAVVEPTSTTKNQVEHYVLGWTGRDSHAKTPHLVLETHNKNTVEVYGTTQSKTLFWNGALHSTVPGVAAYQESLVHPVMMIMVEETQQPQQHEPRLRVAILGGGTGATLRHVLQYDESVVASCTLVEPDAEFLNLARVHLPEWNECRDWIDDANHTNHNDNTTTRPNGYPSCLDHPRARVVPHDATLWFRERYPENGTREEENDDKKLDVIFVDAPTWSMNERLVSALMPALTDRGVLVLPVERAAAWSSLPRTTRTNPVALNTVPDELSRHGMIPLATYHAPHPGRPGGPSVQVQILGRRDSTRRMTTTRSSVFADEPARMDLRLAQTTTDSTVSLSYMDGATWASSVRQGQPSSSSCRRESVKEEEDTVLRDWNGDRNNDDEFWSLLVERFEAAPIRQLLPQQ